MDPVQVSPPITNTQHPEPEAPDFSHLAEELYKKNFELDEQNKTLSLLRKIDEIILSSVTDVRQVAQKIADIVAQDAAFEALSIYLIDAKNQQLTQLALSQTEAIKKIQSQYFKPFCPQRISLTNTANPIVKVVTERLVNSVQTIQDLLTPMSSAEEVQQIAQQTNISASIIYPLIARGETIGALIVCTAANPKDFSQYKNDLIIRLVDVIGIAVYNALLYQRIQEANEHLKQLDQLKDEFVSLAAHELRTPMSSIRSYIWVLKAAPNLNERQRVYMENTYTSVVRLIELVNDMLNVSRIESGRMNIKPKPESIEEVVRETLTELTAKAEEQHITITAPEPIPHMPMVFIDKNKIKEVITNLVGNSLKFTPQGGTISISYSQHNDIVEVHIKDTGSGIKKEDEPKLFQKFGMIEGNYLKTTPGQGTGLGLYICKSIIQLHGGSIWYESAGEGQGTTFTFSIKKA